MTNRNLLKEAIADAKAVKETAIANAKAALQESFNPLLIQSLSEKLAEMDEDDEPLNEVEEEIDENKVPSITEKAEDKPEAIKEEDEEMDLDELLRELDELGKEEMNENEKTPLNDPKNTSTTSHGNIAEEDMPDMEDEDADGIPDDEDEEIDIENMSQEDLTNFVENVIQDMVSSGELEPGENFENPEETPEGEDEEEIEITADENEMVAESKTKKEKKKVEDEKTKKLEKELKEAYDALKTVKDELNEVNLFNAKLLYTNKIFKEKQLTESQKIKVLASFDKAASVKEAKLVYETLNEGLKTPKTTVNESLLRSAASKISGIAPKKPILEVDQQFERWQILAGIKK